MVNGSVPRIGALGDIYFMIQFCKSLNYPYLVLSVHKRNIPDLPEAKYFPPPDEAAPTNLPPEAKCDLEYVRNWMAARSAFQFELFSPVHLLEHLEANRHFIGKLEQDLKTEMAASKEERDKLLKEIGSKVAALQTLHSQVKHSDSQFATFLQQLDGTVKQLATVEAKSGNVISNANSRLWHAVSFAPLAGTVWLEQKINSDESAYEVALKVKKAKEDAQNKLLSIKIEQ